MNSATSSHNTPPLNSVLALEFSGTWLAQQTAVVESIASDRALSESLTRIAQLAESLLVHARVTIHLYDSETGLLTTGAAPSMPDSYRQKVNNIDLTDKMGSCGPAIFSGKPAVCRDTNSDPRWEVFKDTIKEYDIRASWSIPCISSRNKEALGTLCIYWDESRTPREQELEMMVNVTQLFRIAVERHRTKILQQRQLALIEAAVEGIAFLEDDCFVYLNSAYVKMFGYETYRQLKGRSWDCCLDPSQIQHFQHHVLTKLMETNAWQGQTTAKRCDGSLFAMDISLTRIPESNCWVLVCRDVSDRERTEQELRDSRQLLRQIIDHLPQFIGWKDQNLVYQGCNLSGAQLVGLESPAEIIGKTDADLNWSAAEVEWHNYCERLTLQTGKPSLKIVEAQRRADKNQFWVESNRIPLHNSQDEINGILVTVEDITERMNTQQQLESQSAELERFSDALKQIHRLSTRDYESYDALFAAYLKSGCHLLELSTGIIGRLSGEQLILEVIESEHPYLTAGQSVVISESYCDLVVRNRQLVAFPAAHYHPEFTQYSLGYERGIHCYIGAPIIIQEQVFGVLAFLQPEPLNGDFADYERDFVELMASDISKFIASRQSEQARQQVQIALEHSEAKYRSIFENINLGLFQTTKNGQFLSANSFLAQLYGFDSPQALIAQIENVETGLYVYPERRRELVRLTEEFGSVVGFESRVYCQDGSVIWVSENQRAVHNEAGEFLYFEGSVEDITARRLAEEELEHNAFHDKLTGLPNRVWFIEQLKPLLLPRTLNSAPEILPQDSHLIAVMFIDLDRFKVINDSLGHIVGDHLLASVGERLGQNIRTQDGLARFGGDEFAVLLRRLPNREDAFLVASRLVQSFQKPFEVQGHTFSLGISIGIVFGHKDYQVPEDILRDADLAMYQAKYRGGNCYTVFEEVMRPQAMQRLQLEQDLRQAITAEQLCLYYQPIWSLTDHTITGFESLLRWHHPDRGWISPAQFIVIAEETGFIHQLGWWAIEQAVTQFYRWQKTYPAASSLSLNINISAHQIKDRQFPQRFAKLITELDLDGRCLNLEITETSFLETAQYYPENFAFLRKLGVEICIDDFGVGYSSLSRLHSLQVDTIKIDRSFVMDIDVDPQKKAITGTIITLAHQLGAQIIAEGIESEAQQTHLINLKCPFGQGFYLAKPLPVDAASNLIATL